MKSIDSPWYVKITPPYVDSGELFTHLYDKYTSHYNQGNVQAQADFSSILLNIEEREKYKINELDYWIGQFKSTFEDQYTSQAKKPDQKFYSVSGIDGLGAFKNSKEELFDIIEANFDCNRVWGFSEHKSATLYENLVISLRKLHNSVSNNPFKGECIDELLNIFRAYADLIMIGICRKVLNTILDKMLETSFNESLPLRSDLPESEQKEILRKAEPTPEKQDLLEWIQYTAKSIIDSGKSVIKKPETIELYLKTLVKFPTAGVDEIRNKVLNNEDVPECDFSTFENISFPALRGWENRFYDGLKSRYYTEYAQTFKRCKPVK